MRTRIVGSPRTDHPDAVVYRRTADAFRRRDLETVALAIDENVAWHMPGTSWVAREIAGRAALLAYLEEIVTRTAGTFVLEDGAITGTDHHVSAVQRMGATHDGERQMFDVVSVMRFEKGRQLERWFYVVDQSGFDAFFAAFE